ncbi:hypothetical protein G9A89_023399 [Geosiphon pyriformis]|nr:hypothetical protein G9A89_023399 [Geosiphon pyriformis]
MALWANMPYCTPNQKLVKDSLGLIFDMSIQTIRGKEGLIIYFRGPELTRKQWDARKFYLELDNRKNRNPWPIDSEWPKVLTKGVISNISRQIAAFSSSLTGDTVFIYFTGHGIGGVYALYFAIISLIMVKNLTQRLIIDGRKMEVAVITFGQPRGGNFDFAERANDYVRLKLLRIYRVTHSNDHVPQRPYLESTSKPWFHTDREYWISLNCDCSQKKEPEYELFECPGYSNTDSKKYGENKECNLGTDGASNTANYGPYFGTTFGKCNKFFELN